MSALLNAIKNSGQNVKSNVALTANGAISNAETGSKVLDLFGMAGALRNQSDATAVGFFQSAFYENAELALKCLFYFRDIRGGDGQRKFFRNCFRWLATEYPAIATYTIDHVPFYGRYDDLFVLFGTPVEPAVLEYIKNQLTADIENLGKNESISLLAKWLPSINTSSAETKKQGHIVKNYLGLTEREYRKTLVALREKLNVVERELCAKNWSAVNYSVVPSRAGLLYRKAFQKHDSTRYAKWQSDVRSGVKGAKVNASALYPYDIIREVRHNRGGFETLDLQWNALPNYIKGNESFLAIVDTSGSMITGCSGNVQPIDVAISLGMYCAERAKGPFKDHFITFSSTPTLQKIVGNNIAEKVANLERAHWSQSTNIQAAFELILNTAVRNKLSQDDLPSTVLVISDLEFNSCGCRLTNYQAIKQKFANAGYVLPKIVFWRVNSLTNQSPVVYNDIGTALVSGMNASILQYLFNWKLVSPYEKMMEVLNSERYKRVKLPENTSVKTYNTVKNVLSETKEVKQASKIKSKPLDLNNVLVKLGSASKPFTARKRDSLGRFVS